MLRLERYRGHFFNWYDTRTLAPLEPRFVSTVDRGNLLGALVRSLRAGLEELSRHPLVPPRFFQGIAVWHRGDRPSLRGTSGKAIPLAGFCAP